MLVNCSGLERGKNIAGQKFLAQVLDNNFAGAGLVRLFNDCLEVVALAHIGNHGDHVV